MVSYATIHHSFLPHNESRGFILDPSATGVSDNGHITQLDFIADLSFSCRLDDDPYVSGVTVSKELISGVISVASGPILAFTALKKNWTHGHTLFLESLADGYAGWVTPGRVNLLEIEGPVTYVFTSQLQSRIAERCLFRRDTRLRSIIVDGVSLTGVIKLAGGAGLSLAAVNGDVVFELSDEMKLDCANGFNYIERYREVSLSAVGCIGGACPDEEGVLGIRLEGPFIFAPIEVVEDGFSRAIGGSLGIDIGIEDVCEPLPVSAESPVVAAEVCEPGLPPRLTGCPGAGALVYPDDPYEPVLPGGGNTVTYLLRLTPASVTPLPPDGSYATVQVGVTLPTHRLFGGVVIPVSLTQLPPLFMEIGEERYTISGWTATDELAVTGSYSATVSTPVKCKEWEFVLPVRLLDAGDAVYASGSVTLPGVKGAAMVAVSKVIKKVVVSGAAFSYEVVPSVPTVIGSAEFTVSTGTAIQLGPQPLNVVRDRSVWQYNTTVTPERQLFMGSPANPVASGGAYALTVGSIWTFGTAFQFRMQPRLVSGPGDEPPPPIEFTVEAASSFTAVDAGGKLTLTESK